MSGNVRQYGAMYYAFVSLLGAALLGSVGGCGSSTAGQYKLNGIDYNVVTAGSLTHAGTNVTGSGSIVFVTPLTGSKNSYKLVVTLQAGGSVDLVAHASATLTGGSTVRILQTARAFKAGKPGAEQPINPASTAPVSVVIDIHNAEGGSANSHLAIWDGSATNFTSGFLLNLEPSSGDAITAGTGGTLWGLVLSNATVTEATPGAAKNPDI